MNKTVEIIEKAIELLSKEDGWIQHDYSKDDGYGNNVAYCMLGALATAADVAAYEFETGAEFRPVIKAIVEQIDPEKVDGQYAECVIADFNDDYNTTQEDVLLVMKKAIS